MAEKDKVAIREARWAEKVADLPPEKREKRMEQFRKKAAELDAMSKEERAKYKEERKAKKAPAA
jgi:hypothetical protein